MGYLILAFIAMIIVLLYTTRNAKKDTITKGIKSSFEDLTNEGFNTDKYFDTRPSVAFDVSSRKIAFIFKDAFMTMPSSNILTWKHTWIEQSRENYITTNSHIININTRDINMPLIKVYCGKDMVLGEQLNATLNAFVNG